MNERTRLVEKIRNKSNHFDIALTINNDSENNKANSGEVRLLLHMRDWLERVAQEVEGLEGYEK